MTAVGTPTLVARPAAAEPTSAIRERSRLAAYVELTKPGITRLVVLTAAAGFYMATRGAFDWVAFGHTLLGVALVASAAGALNQIVERDADARMRRTARRPLPAGQLRAGPAAAFAWSMAALGTIELAVFVRPLTAVLVVLSLLSYVYVYTPLKRRTWHATLVGAVPGALPILAGWTAGGGALDRAGWALFAILFIWQMPHFFALAWMYRRDYVAGGFRMITATDQTGARTTGQILIYTTALLPVSLAPFALGLTGGWYAAGALLLGCLFLAAGAMLVPERTERRARRLFFASILYLPALLALMVLDKVAA